jgi:hypothetical protein
VQRPVLDPPETFRVPKGLGLRSSRPSST